MELSIEKIKMEKQNKTLIYFQFAMIVILLAVVLFRKPIDPRPNYLPIVEQIIEVEAGKIEAIKDTLGELEIQATYLIEKIERLKLEIYASDSVITSFHDLY